MERTTFCLLFYIRRTKLNRNGEAPIMMRITVNGVRVDASVKKTILPEFWSAAKGKALEKKREYKELNLYLDSIRLRIMKIQRELEIEGVAVSAGSVLDRFWGKDAPVQRTLFEVFREHNDKCARLSGTDMAPATVQRYETSLKHTQDFVWETYHVKAMLKRIVAIGWHVDQNVLLNRFLLNRTVINQNRIFWFLLLSSRQKELLLCFRQFLMYFRYRWMNRI